MKASASLPANTDKMIANQRYNKETIDAYQKKAQMHAKREQLSEAQKTSILADWASRYGRGRAKIGLPPEVMHEDIGKRHIEEVQNNAKYIGEILGEVTTCDLGNVIHAAKMRRQADAHASRAKAIRDQLKAEVRRAKAAQNSCNKFGVKNISAPIGDQKAQSITCVIRDQDTQDGGKKGR